MLPEDEVFELREKIRNIDDLRNSIMLFEYKFNGEDSLVVEGVKDDVNSDNALEKARQYIDAVDDLIDDLKKKITLMLRKLCGT